MKNNGNDNLHLGNNLHNVKFKFRNVTYATDENIKEWKDNIPQEYKDFSRKLMERIEFLHKQWQSIEDKTKARLQLLEEERKELEQIIKEKESDYSELCKKSNKAYRRDMLRKRSLVISEDFNSPNQYFAMIDGELYFSSAFYT